MREPEPQPAGEGQAPITVESLYNRWGPDLYRYALMILADPGGAEDAMHQVFAKLVRMKQLPAAGSWEKYLRTAVRNECFRLLPTRPAAGLDAVQPFLETRDAAPMDDDERAMVEKALRRLTPDQREVVHLKIYEGRTFQDIADFLDIPLNTAASRYRYALDRLRKELASLKDR